MVDTLTTHISDLQSKLLKSELRRHLYSLANLASKYEDGVEYPNTSPVEFARLVRSVAQVIDIDKVPPHQLVYVSLLLADLTKNLQFVDQSRVTNTPWSMIQTLEAFLRDCSDEDTHFLIHPQWSYNYAVSSREWVGIFRTMLSPIRVQVDEWEAKAGIDPNTKIHTISFPRIEKNNVLMHALLGHEVGHIVSAEQTLEFSIDIWQKEEAGLKKAFTKHLREEYEKRGIDSDLFRENLIETKASSSAKRTLELFRQAAKELIADFLGVHLLGPACFAAFTEYASRLDVDASPLRSGGYPPPRYRLREMAKEIRLDIEQTREMGNGTAVAPFLKWLEEIVFFSNTQNDITEIKADIVTREAYKLVERHLPTLRAQIIEKLPERLKAPYRLADNIKSISELSSKLVHHVPPCEVGQWPDTSPATLADILNAGWAYKLDMLDKDPEWATPENMENLFRMLLKAIEASYVFRVYGSKLKKLEEA